MSRPQLDCRRPFSLPGTLALVLQGGRDYQATVADDLARWQAALSGRPDVTIRVYSADNHFFFAGSGPSTPQESMSARHVDSAVVAAIADWLGTVPVAAAGAEQGRGPPRATGRAAAAVRVRSADPHRR